MNVNIGRIILFLLLATCFSFQVWDSWQKFWDGKTLMAVSLIPAPLETLPAITLCTEPFTNADIMRDKLKMPPDMLTLRSYDENTVFKIPFKCCTFNDIWEQSSYTPNWIKFGKDNITIDGINFNTGDEISKVKQLNS
jgi:hypothetical protein